MEEAASVTAARRHVLAAFDKVAVSLGNTRAVCRKCYVHPAIVETYLEGRSTRRDAAARGHEGPAPDCVQPYGSRARGGRTAAAADPQGRAEDGSVSYSVRNACIGSIDAARAAGTRAASALVTAIAHQVAASTDGSPTGPPPTTLAATLARPIAAPVPTNRPAATSRAARRQTRPIVSVARRPECDPHSDFSPAFRHHVRKHAV